MSEIKEPNAKNYLGMCACVSVCVSESIHSRWCEHQGYAVKQYHSGYIQMANITQPFPRERTDCSLLSRSTKRRSRFLTRAIAARMDYAAFCSEGQESCVSLFCETGGDWSASWQCRVCSSACPFFCFFFSCKRYVGVGRWWVCQPSAACFLGCAHTHRAHRPSLRV